MNGQNEIRKEITNRIIDALEKNVLPWRKPWSTASGRHANAVSKQAYRGINPLLLEIHAENLGLSSRYWATFKQWKQLGGMVQRRPDDVKSGQWGCKIVFCKPITRTVKDKNGDEQEEEFMILRTYSVFNCDQVDGAAVDQFRADTTPTTVVPDFEPAEKLIAATKADLRFGGDRAFYRRPAPLEKWPKHESGDFIQMPHKSAFNPIGSYYETVFHELAHWSEIRLDWKGSYAMGELIAEMSACFVGQEVGVPLGEPLENHVAYLKSWLKEMMNDTKFIFQASSQASKVTDYLLSFAQK